MTVSKNSIEDQNYNDKNFIVVLPIYNEVESVELMIETIKSHDYPLIITDGGSNDGSIEIAEKHNIPILHRPNKGKGFGLNMALDYAKEKGYKYMVYMDCDLTYPVHQIKDLLSYRYQYDMVVGNRYRKFMTPKSKMLNFSLRHILNFLFWKKYKDPASGFRVLLIDKFLNKIQIEGIDVEIDLFGIAHRNNLTIKEVDIDYYIRSGQSKVTFYDLVKVLKTIFQVRFIHKNTY